MKKLTFIGVLSFLFSLTVCVAQEAETKGIQFFHGTFSEACKLAEKENKLIFMDAYATWCGPCKRMAASVFPDPAVGEFYNSNFINLKMDMEKAEGPALGQKYGVRSYPTLLYISSDGKVVHQEAGARPSDAFIELGKTAIKKIDRSGEYEKKYNDGQRDGATVLAYIKAMNQAGKPSLRITNDYLNNQKNLSTPENLEIILEGTTEADSKVFDLLLQHKSEIIALKSKEVFNKKVQSACQKTFKKSLEYRNEGLLMEAQTKIKNVPAVSAEFKAKTDMQYFGETGNATKFLNAANTFSQKIAKKNPAKLKELSSFCMKYFPTNKDVLNLAEKTAKTIVQYESLQENYLHYALILKQNGKKNEAISILKKGIELAKSKSEPTHSLDFMLKDLEGV